MRAFAARRNACTKRQGAKSLTDFLAADFLKRQKADCKNSLFSILPQNGKRQTHPLPMGAGEKIITASLSTAYGLT
ncbi:MAG: hypothetical protein A2V79_00730 [Betaproteobacteria bacterium RBG_16_56_24]|nr:MAG: hypothetical protein A2V79_00730 [Betaproteobacteria bacterium RBG_16_56_24]